MAGTNVRYVISTKFDIDENMVSMLDEFKDGIPSQII